MPDSQVERESAGDRTAPASARDAWLERAKRGVCNICGETGSFELPAEGEAVDDVAQLRERLPCSSCGGISRDRALIVGLAGLLGERRPLAQWSPRPEVRMFETSGYRGHPRFLPGLFDYFNLPYAAPPEDDSGPAIDARTGADVQDLQFPDGFFNLAMSAEVLEHVPDARAAISELARILAPGGHLVLEVPYSHEWDRSFVRVHRWHGRDVYLYPPEYHAEDTLVYRVYGRELLADLGGAGLATAHLNVDIAELGISPQPVIVATKQPYIDLAGFRVSSWLTGA